jgi:Oxygenase domain of the 2OGFeDO superfamily
MFTEIRVRSKLTDEAMESRVGRIMTQGDVDVEITGPTKLYGPTGAPLAVYLPQALKHDALADNAYPILTTIRGTTENRGLASGTPVDARHVQNNMVRSKPVMSSILGSFEASGYYKYCRLTSWTAHEMEKRWPELLPLLRAVSEEFKKYVPDRYAAQMSHVNKTAEDWVIPGTPFTTITVNNTYSTGVHQDKGDLDEGFSCLAVIRRGEYTGGKLTFPAYRIGVDLQDGDLLLMNAHEWHGNTAMFCACGNELREGPCETCGAERISVVCYFRTKMVACGTADQEQRKAIERADQLNEGTLASA